MTPRLPPLHDEDITKDDLARDAPMYRQSNFRWWGGACPASLSGTSDCVAVTAHRCGDITYAGETPEASRKAVEVELRRYTRLITTCGKRGKLPQAFATVMEMKDHGIPVDARVFDALVSACLNNGCWEEALRVLQQFQPTGFVLPESTYNDLISACGKALQWQVCLQLLADLQVKRKTVPQVSAYNSAMRACKNCQQWPVILRLFDEMEQHSLIHYNAAQELRTEMSECLPPHWQRWEQRRAKERPSKTLVNSELD
eukprot:TRINITY_DN26774_c0_g1_i1.p1 TRINITY_DN26774_c0_g1~~TRINITY_DN26774_c0_g1_i1.p1  ORF type:complete len:257 (+),score=46.11 TRINITY_DN26774_c0_g1_i1:62-832(+)